MVSKWLINGSLMLNSYLIHGEFMINAELMMEQPSWGETKSKRRDDDG